MSPKKGKGGGSRTKKIKVTVPAVRLDLVRGEGYMSGSQQETKSKLERKREELAALELDADILEVEDKIRRRQRGEPVEAAPKSDLGEKLVEEVVMPIVRKRLEEDEGGKENRGVVDRALRIAERAVGRTPRGERTPSSIDEIDKAIDVFTKIKGLFEKEERERPPEEAKREEDVLSQLERGMKLVQQMRETFAIEGAGGEGASQALIDFKKWEKQFESDQRERDRAYNLKMRRQDKDHDARLVELGIERERNDLLRDGLKRIGNAVARALLEEEAFEEEEEAPPKRGRGKLITEKCAVCGTEISIPPEAQVAGKEIKCGKCESVFVWS